MHIPPFFCRLGVQILLFGGGGRILYKELLKKLMVERVLVSRNVPSVSSSGGPPAASPPPPPDQQAPTIAVTTSSTVQPKSVGALSQSQPSTSTPGKTKKNKLTTLERISM